MEREKAEKASRRQSHYASKEKRMKQMKTTVGLRLRSAEDHSLVFELPQLAETAENVGEVVQAASSFRWSGKEPPVETQILRARLVKLMEGRSVHPVPYVVSRQLDLIEEKWKVSFLNSLHRLEYLELIYRKYPRMSFERKRNCFEKNFPTSVWNRVEVAGRAELNADDRSMLKLLLHSVDDFEKAVSELDRGNVEQLLKIVERRVQEGILLYKYPHGTSIVLSVDERSHICDAVLNHAFGRVWWTASSAEVQQIKRDASAKRLFWSPSVHTTGVGSLQPTKMEKSSPSSVTTPAVSSVKSVGPLSKLPKHGLASAVELELSPIPETEEEDYKEETDSRIARLEERVKELEDILLKQTMFMESQQKKIEHLQRISYRFENANGSEN